MSSLNAAADSLWTSFTSVIKSFKFPVDVIDILVVAYVIYHGIRLVRETRALQLVKGIAAILVIYFVAMQLNMITLSFFMRNIISVGSFLLVVLFQPELRSAMEKMGRTQLTSISAFMAQSQDEAEKLEHMIDILVRCCVDLSGTKTGALIVIERKTKLGDVINTGTVIDAEPSKELIGNIFFTNSPLHDGAMIIRDCRLHAAGCYLPLSQNMEISKDLGTRHRAALGMSEVSDAVIIVVSEETGAITIASEAKLQRRLSENNLRRLLQNKLIKDAGKENEEEKKKGGLLGFWKGKK